MRLTLVAITALWSGWALAQPVQDRGPPERSPAIDGWSVTVGTAPVVGPAWQGSKDYVLSIYPDLRVNYGEVFFASIPDGVGLNAINASG